MANSIFQLSPLDAASADIEASIPETSLGLPALPDIPSAPTIRAPSGSRSPSGPVAIPTKLKPVFEQAATRYRVPVNVLMALAEQESRYNPMATGVQTQWGRAKGMMQYLDSTAARLGINPYNPVQSIDAAAKQLRERLDKGYSMPDAVKEHFAGPDRKLWGKKTRVYGAEVLSRAARIKGELAPEYAKRSQQARLPKPKAATPAKAEESSGLLGLLTDSGTALLSGLNSTTEAATELVRRIPVVGQHIVDAMDRADRFMTGKGTQEILSGNKRQYDAQFTPEMRAARAKQWVIEPGDDLGNGKKATGYNFGAAWSDPRTYLSGILESTPEMVLTMGPAGRLAKMTYSAAIARGATRAAAAQSAARVATVAGGVSEGLLGGAHSSVEVRDEIMGMTAEQLGKSQAYKNLIADGMKPDEAKRALAEDAATQAFLISGTITGLFGGMGDRAMAKIITGPMESRLKRIASGAVGEGLLEELPQSVGQQMAQNYAVSDADPERPLMKGVANEAAGGAVLGSVMGGGIAALVPHAASASEDAAALPLPPSEALAETVAAEQQAPTGPLGRARSRAQQPVAADVPLPRDPDAPAKPLTLVADGVEHAVELVGETADAVWVKRPGGDELQIPRSDIEAGRVQLIDPASVEQSSTVAPSQATAVEENGMAVRPVNLKEPLTGSPNGNPAPVAASATTDPTEVVDPITGEILSADPDIALDPTPAQPRERRPKVERKKTAAPESADMSGLSEQELRARLKYLSEQARTNAGWTKPLLAEKKRVSAAIDAMNAARESTAEAAAADPAPLLAVAIDSAALLPKELSGAKPRYNFGDRSFTLNFASDVEKAAFIAAQDKPSRRDADYVAFAITATGMDVAAVRAMGKEVRARIKELARSAKPGNLTVPAAPTPAEQPANQSGSALAEAEARAATSPENNLPEPTEAQKEAGNYQKGHVGIGALDISIENPAGTSRRPEWPPLKHTYGYVKGSHGADGDHVDVFLGPNAEDTSRPVFIVDQVNEDHSFDEHKVMIGFANEKAARAGYLANYERGWQGLGAITEMPFDAFTTWVKDKEATAKPAGKLPPSPAKAARPQPAQGVTETVTPDDMFAKVWKSGAFKKAAKALGSPHRESPVAAEMVRGWIDGQARDLAALDREMDGPIADTIAAVKNPVGWNPAVGYIEGFYAAVTGEPREIRARATASTLGAGPAHDELTAMLSGGKAVDGPSAPAPAAKADPFANNKLFTADKVEAARARIREKMGRINSGVDPELFTDGMTIAAAYIEAGVRSFAEYASAMRDDFGKRITPYLLSFWEGARNYPGLDTEDMSTPEESRAHHSDLLREGLPVDEASALGTEVARPAKKAKAARPAGARTLRDDWGVDHIDGRMPIEGGKNQETDFGLKGGLKDAFLADATAYLRAVSTTLAALGFAPHVNAKGKAENPVSRNAGGPAVSGEVSLHLYHADTGANVYATVGASALRGAVPTNSAGVTIMYRVSRKEGDKQAVAGVNRWTPTDLTAVDLADTIAWETTRQQPELTREYVRPSEPVEQGGDRGGISSVSGGGRVGDDPAARPDIGELGTGQPQDVGEPAGAGPDAEDGIRGSGTDVAAAGRADAPGPSGDGREGVGGTRGAAAGTGDAGTDGQRPSSRATRRGAEPEGQVAATDGRSGELDLFPGAPKQGKSDSAPVDPATITPALPAVPSPARPVSGNFHIANPLEIVGGGPVARFDRNRQAIETFNRIRDEGRPATADEQRTLADYTGWGSFGQELFQGTWNRAMPKDGWQERDKWLRGHMGKDEWESAQRSITNAHYTDPPTVMAMWAMMERMGFKGGRVLEPSMGIGNFFGMMPAPLAARSQLAGIELDSLTGGMAQLLYPDANIRVMGYQDSKTPDGFYDAVIGNWPFENTVIADRRYDRLSPFLHDYFFLKAVDQVRAGGIVMGITSSGSMDKKAAGIRRELAKKAELVAAYRLPSGAFAEYAGTKVVTDIVILRKRAEPIALADKEGWIDSVPYQTPNGEVFINEYFVANPANVIGKIDFGHGTTRGAPGMIVHRPDNMAEQLAALAQTVPEGAYVPEQRAAHISYVANHTADREGALTRTDKGLFIVRGEHLAPAAEVRAYAVKDQKETAARVDQLERLIDMRQKYGALIDSERNGDPAKARKALKSSYDAFIKAHGALSDSFGLSYLRKVDDPFYPALAALEIDGQPAAILSRSTTRGAPAIASPNVAEAFVLERNSSVNPSLSAIAARAGVSPDAAKAELISSGAVFELPSGDVLPTDMYLSGNVREKLRQAKAAVAEGMAHLQRNVDALTEVVPADIPYFKIETQLGATWVSPQIYGEFVGHMLGVEDGKGVEVRFNGGRWTVRIDERLKNRMEARTGYGSGEYSFQRLVNAAFSNQTVTIRRRDSDGAQYVDAAATEEVNGKISEMRTKFADWLWSDPERRVAVETEYNEVRNAFATPKFDGSFLRFEGMALSLGNGPFDLRQHQADAIWRALVSRRSLNAHEVGTGKTFTMGGIAVESRRYGIARKPLILAHNANSKTVAAEIQQMYPASKVLYIDNLSPATIDVKMRQIANDDWDAIVVPHSLIDRFAFTEETLMDMAREEIAALEEEAYAAAEDDGATIKDEMWDDPEELKKLRSITAKELVKMRQRIIETIKKQSHRASREGAISFEELGVDMLMVDEAHEFKKPPISTRMKMKGLNTQTSDRSIALSFLTRYVRAQNSGGNVHLFTGTPITNTLTEVFHMMRYIMQEEMQAAGVDQWDGWFGSFAREVMDVEQNAAAEYEAVTRLAGFINVPELRRMIGQYMDVVFADDMPEMQPRRTKSGKTMADELSEAERAELLNGRSENAKDRPYKKVINVTSDLTDAQKVIFEQLRGYARSWRSMSGKERKEAMAAGAPESPIITEGLAAKASFDVRLYDGEQLAGQEGSAHDDPGSKASRVVANVKEIYDSHPLATQVIFAEQGFSNRVTRSLGRDDDGKRKTRTFPAFSTIRDIVERLVATGIPHEQIAIVDGSTSKDKRKQIALDMNAAKIRVVIGSTGTLGVGVNMQKNLRAMHHMDAPWMPGDLEQRNGRGQRQANQWNTVLEYRYLTDRLDGRRWQVLAIKQRFITAFLKADDSARTIEGEAAADEQSDILQSFAEAAGDPRILIREKLRKQLEGVQRRERLHTQGIANALSQARLLSAFVAETEAELAEVEQRGTVAKAAKLVSDNAGPDFSMKVDGKTYDSRKEAEEAIDAFAAFNMRVGDEPRRVGAFGGHDLMLNWPAHEQHPGMFVVIEGQKFQGGSVQGLEQSLRRFGADMAKKREKVAEQHASIERLRSVAAEPFHMGDKLGLYEKQLADLELDIKANPVPPPAWLRAGAPVDTEVHWKGATFTVSGHRWSADGWFVLATDEKGAVTIPYMEAKDAQGMGLYEERPFEAPEVVDPKSVRSDEATTDAESPASYSIGGLSGGGFASAEGLRQHLIESRLGGAIRPLIDRGRIVLHDTADTLPLDGQSSQQTPANPAWGRAIDRIVRGEKVDRFVRVGPTPKLLREMGLNAADLYMASGKFRKVRVEHPEVSLEVLKALPWLLEKPDAIVPSARGDGSIVVAVPAVDSDGSPVIVPIIAEARGNNIVLSIYGKAAGVEWIAREVERAKRDGAKYYVRKGFADAVPKPDPASSREASSSSPAPIAAEGPAKPTRKILTLRKESKTPAAPGLIQGMTAPDGRVHLVADRLTSRTALPVLLHEMFHSGVRPLIGSKAWDGLMGRMRMLHAGAVTRAATAERSNSDFWTKALASVEAAQPMPGQEVEELAAYAIEHQAQAPAGLRDLVRRMIGAMKAWLLRRFNLQAGAVTPAQLEALAVAALRSGSLATAGSPAVAGGTYYSRIVPSAEQIDAATPGFIHSLVTQAMDGKASVLAAVPLRPLLSELARPIPAAQDYLRLKQEMDQTRDSWHARADAVAQPWLKFRVLHKAENVRLMDMMHEATLAGVDPSKPFQSALTKLDRQIIAEGPGTEAYEAARAKAQHEETRKASHARLLPLFNALSPEARRLFNEVRDNYRALSDEFEITLADNLSKALDIKIREAERAYDVEMMRIVESKMTNEARDEAVARADMELRKVRQMQGWAKGARMTRLRHHFETNNLSGPYFPLARFGNFFVTVRDANDEVVSFSRFEKANQQAAFAKEMKKAGYDVAFGILEDGGALKKQVDARFVADIESILEGADVDDTVRDAVWQRWLESMPDMSIRKSRIHRKGRAGYSQDALRAFGHHMFHGAHQLARLKYSLDMDEQVALARDQAKTMPDPVRSGLIVNELARRHQFVMNPTGGAIAQAVTSAAFIYFLSVSPAAAIVNTAQTAVMGVPLLAAYHGSLTGGSARASAELTKALRDFTGGRGHAGQSRRLTDDERKAMEAAYETGLIERTQSHDLAGVGDTGVAYSPARAKVMSAISWAFHHTERMNREVTFLAAYRMARKKGESHDMAIDTGAKLTWKIHFDYQNTSRPRVMQGDTAKVLFVFRNFNVNMLWRLFRDTHQAVKGGSKEERREARIQLAGVTGMMMLSAGIRGTWLFGIAMLLAGLFFGDDAEDDFANLIVAALGRRLGGVALNGVPGHLTGTDLSSRIGMPDLWFRSPDRELEGATEFDYWAMQVLGAGVGALRNMWTGASQIGDGHVWRGVETMMPKFAKDLMRSARYTAEGATTLQGDPIMEDMGAPEAFKQALGFTPAGLAERYERNRSMKNREQRILDERKTITADFDKAVRDGEDTAKAEQRLAAFNESNPDYPITMRSIRQSMRSREQMRERKVGGVALSPKLAERLNAEAPELLYSEEAEE